MNKRKTSIYRFNTPLTTKSGAGFTLMEVIVAVMIFAIVSVAMMTLFNYTLKINRRSEALRQATQGMRNFMESLVKEIRNGQIDYAIVNGTAPRGFVIGPCGDGVVGANYYSDKENRLGIINVDGNEECIYYGDEAGTYLPGTFTYSNGTVVLEKWGGLKQIFNPPNFKVENLMFLIRPLCDPYTSNCVAYGNSHPHIQPFVTILAKFVTQLPTGEKVSIYYQTSVSTNKYDIPN